MVLKYGTAFFPEIIHSKFSSSEQIGMGACVEHEEFKAVIVLPPCHKPVALDVALPYSGIPAAENVRTIFWRKFTVSGKNGDGILKEPDVQTSPLTASIILLKSL